MVKWPYIFAFDAVAKVFDDPQNKEIRHHFVKSISFLAVDNSTQSSQPSRFD